MKTTDYKHTCHPEDAPRIWEWITNRGGIVRWPSVDLADLGRSWTTPYKDEHGEVRTEAPHWKAPRPSHHITDIDDVCVAVDREVKRFRVAIRRSSNGLSMKVTDAGSRRIREAVAKAGVGAYHTFDYETQEAVIMAPESVLPLSRWMAQAKKADPNIEEVSS